MILQLAPGIKLANGKYKLSQQLGEGGMATVWAAACNDPQDLLPEEIVLKILLPEIHKDPEKRKFFIEEARLSTQLNHPYIVRVFCVEQWNEIDLLVMERVWGQGLDQLIQLTYQQKSTPIPWPIAVRICAMIAEALHYANTTHDSQGRQLNVIHRDIKPGNILFTADGQIKVIDFGIAKASTSQIKTQTGLVKGTIAYMSPEQLRGERLDIRSDLFSLGIALFELCTGQRPFFGENFTSLMFNILTKAPFHPKEFRSDLPDGLCSFLMDTLDKHPDKRPTNAKEFQQRLEQFLAPFPEEGSIKALKNYFARQFPELVAERSETAKLLAKTDPESLPNITQIPRPPGAVFPIQPSSKQEHQHLPTGELTNPSKGHADPNLAFQPTDWLNPNAAFTQTPAPFPQQLNPSSHGPNSPYISPTPTPQAIETSDFARHSPHATPTELPPTKDIPQEDIPKSSSLRPILLVLSFVLLTGTATAAFLLLRKPATPAQTSTPPPPRAQQVAMQRTVTPPPAPTPRPAPTTPTPTPPAPTAPANPEPQVRPPAVVSTPAKRRTRPSKRTRRRRRTTKKRPQRVALVRPAPTPEATTGYSRVLISPPCDLYNKGKKLGTTLDPVLFSATPGRHTLLCKSRKYLFSYPFTVEIQTNNKVSVFSRQLRKGSLRVYAAGAYGNVFLKMSGSNPIQLGSTPIPHYSLYEGRYTIVIINGTNPSIRQKRTITIRANKMQTLKIKW